MSRENSAITNLWGKQTDSTMIGLEPQRNDIYYIDFSNAKNKVEAATNNFSLPPILPQYVRSITLPEIRTKADTFRRDSIPFNMPSWDDPLDAVKIVFLMDMNLTAVSAVVRFLELWLTLTRAGRGSRNSGYPGFMTLNPEYLIDFRFNVVVYLLCGALPSTQVFMGTDTNAWKQFLAQSAAAFRSSKAAQQGNIVQSNAGTTLFSGGVPQEQDMIIHSSITLKNAWLAAYKISDFSYTESSLVTVDATFYVDDLYHQGSGGGTRTPPAPIPVRGPI